MTNNEPKPTSKKQLTDHIGEVLDVLTSPPFCLSIKDSVVLMANFDKPRVAINNELMIQDRSECWHKIVFADSVAINLLEKKIYQNFEPSDAESLSRYIKHNLTTHIPDKKKTDSGQYYTPEIIVSLVREMANSLLVDNSVILDPACGAGAFLDIGNQGRSIGVDINNEIIEILTMLGQTNVHVGNSLCSVSREKFGIAPDESLIIVSNPPWNNPTSLYKQKIKSKVDVSMDTGLSSTDIGKSFMLAMALLHPDYMILVHPLSYLIKKSNFNSLIRFANEYRLASGFIVGSHTFPDLVGGVEFPVVIALYERGRMDYHWIEDFEFVVVGEKERFRLSCYNTIDGYIRKYPTKTTPTTIKKSDIDLYMFTIRDVNSLKTSGNIQTNIPLTKTNYITIDLIELHRYAYLNMFKHYFPNHFLYGNLSPLVDISNLEMNEWFRDLMIMGLMIKNQRFDTLNPRSPSSLLYSKGFHERFAARAIEGNIYAVFIASIADTTKEQIILDVIKEYFDRTYKKRP